MRQMTSQSFVIKLKQSSQGAEYAGTDQSHDDAGQKHAAHAGKDCRLEFHIQKTGSQAPVPGSGIPTNRSRATKRPRPAVSCSF